MEAITRDVSDIPADDLPAFEHLIGGPLRQNQQVVLKVVEKESGSSGTSAQAPPIDLPEYFNVYDGLTDEEIDELDAAIQQRLDLTRGSE